MFSYQSLDVYKKAYQSNRKVYRMLKERSSLPHYVKNQLGRASLSIMLNIAEGSAKFSKKDRRNFYVTARGSAFECASLVSFLCEENELPITLKEDLCKEYDEISRILFAIIKKP